MTDFRLHRTHISTLLFAGDAVFKFKRPVKLPFVDFSTRARRLHFCQEELRLNRRTAPALYRGLVHIGGEPAVWMRRFDEAQLFHALARAGRLQAAQVDALAAVLARWQATLPPLPRTGPGGVDAAAVATRWAAANLRELQAMPQAAALQDDLAALAAWDAAQARTLAPLLQARQDAGSVVEGHGDLHLGNIVWFDGAPRPFDALEFEPELRAGDRIADPAFTFMDLLDHGLPALAWRFASAWCEATGDFEALPLLRWQAAYRAAVRAKVALIEGHGETAARRLALARALAHPTDAAPGAAAGPTLWVTAGLSGSGKSTVAQRLLEAAGAVRVRSDVERKRLHGLAPTDRPATGRRTGGADPALLYGAEATARTYARLHEAAAAALRGGVSVVVDAACLRRAERDALRALAQGAGAAFRLLWCSAPPDALAARLVRRQAEGQDPSDADTAVLALQQRVAEPPAADEGAEPVLNDGSLEALAQQVARRFGRDRPLA